MRPYLGSTAGLSLFDLVGFYARPAWRRFATCPHLCPNGCFVCYGSVDPGRESARRTKSLESVGWKD